MDFLFQNNVVPLQYLFTLNKTSTNSAVREDGRDFLLMAPREILLIESIRYDTLELTS